MRRGRLVDGSAAEMDLHRTPFEFLSLKSFAKLKARDRRAVEVVLSPKWRDCRGSVLPNLGVYFLVPHRPFLRFDDLSDMVRRTPSANPAAEEIKIKTAWGIATVANSRCASTGSVFWTTRTATKIAKTEAVMSFRLRIGL
jgi:hypothetical protein